MFDYKRVTVKIDRPMGSFHPEHKDLFYPINYGYIEGLFAGDGEEQDAYILGIDEPVAEFSGKECSGFVFFRTFMRRKFGSERWFYFFIPVHWFAFSCYLNISHYEIFYRYS